MSADRTNQARAGMVVGNLVGVVFGLVFIEVNSGGLPGGAAMVVRVAGVVIAVLLLAAVVWMVRTREVDGEVPSGGFAGRRYWNIVGFEGLALFGGLVVINGVLEQSLYAVPWIAVVVGVHFVVLGYAWRIALHRWLGIAQTGLGIAGFVLAAAGAAAGTVNLVAGVLSGVALYVAVAIAVAGSRPAGELSSAADPRRA